MFVNMRKRLLSLLLVFIMVVGLVPAGYAAFLPSDEAADELYALGLFRGTEKGYELSRSATRQEALVMLIRLIGKESTALNGNWSHPFTDVKAWADKYVGYAYTNNITYGTSATTFGAEETASAAQYLTFVLRALEYSEDAGDFTWRTPWILTDSIKLTAGQYDASTTQFWRGDVASVSYAALDIKLKTGSMTLREQLISQGAIPGEGQTLNATQISQKAGPAVFYIETYYDYIDYSNWDPMSMGSGFLIHPSGIAVTNYHVLEGSHFATAVLISGEAYDISHIIYADEFRDLAIVKLDNRSYSGEVIGSFPYLEMGDSNAVQNGNKAYAIGSPLGLQNTISEGIISNTSRILDGYRYIQTSAQISPGSSGGAMLNEKGQVTGITTAYFEGGQNLNLAIPINDVKAVDYFASGVEYELYFGDPPSEYYTISAYPEYVDVALGDVTPIWISIDYPYDDAEISFIMDDWNISDVTDDYYWDTDYDLVINVAGLQRGTTTLYLYYSMYENDYGTATVTINVY